MIEKEYKYLLAEEEFYSIIKKLETFEYNEKNEIVQTNFYYDTDDCFLHKHNCTLRVREKNGEFFQQLKMRKADFAGCIISSETKTQIQEVPYSIASKQIEALEVDCEFKLLSSLTTHRTSFVFDNFSVDCDVNTYAGIQDYEIEIEFSEEPPKMILELFKNHPTKCVSKYNRFLMRLNSKKESFT